MRSWVAIAALVTAIPALAQTDLDEALQGFEDAPAFPNAEKLDEALEGFDDPPALVQTEGGRQNARNGRIRFSGTLGQQAVFNVAHAEPEPGESHRQRGLSSLLSRIELAAKADLDDGWQAYVSVRAAFDLAPRIRGRRSYAPEFLAEYEREAEFGEVFLRGSLAEDLDLKIGRQIAVWGRSDMFRIVDVLNPTDNRTPGMTELESLRIPVGMARFDFHVVPWKVSALFIPETRFDRIPVPGNDFHGGPSSLPARDRPDAGLGTPRVAAGITGTFPGWDLSLHAAQLFASRPHVLDTAEGERRRHSPLQMAGLAGSLAAGNWLIKGEAALFQGLRFTNVRDREFNRASTLLGVEYSGIARTTLAVEAMNDHILDFDPRLVDPPDERRRNEPAIAFRISRRFLNDSVEASMLATVFGDTGGESGALARFEITHQLTDAIEVRAGAVSYHSGNQAPFHDIGENDRVYVSVKYHF